MALTFEWDARKDAVNQRKHGVSFKEASTAFGDPLSWFLADEVHSEEEVRSLLLGRSALDRLIAVLFTERGGELIRIISTRRATPRERRNMKKTSARRPRRVRAASDEIPAEVDFSRAVRNPYAARYAAGSNVVVLEPDVAALFPNAVSVNEALRSLAKVMAGGKTKRRAGRRTA